MAIKGTLVPALTFFDKDGNVDEEFVRWHLGWVLDNGVNGLFVTGTYGSGYLMTPEQRVRVFEIAMEVSNARPGTFVVGHVGANDTNTSVYLTEKARDLGLAAVSAVNPYTFKYTDDELCGYYADLVAAAGDMPVFAYNNPDLTSKAIEFGLVKKFMKVGLKAMKDSSLNLKLANSIYTYNKLNGTDFKYISGSTTGWPTFIKLGVDTMIAGVCNYAPELVAAMYKLSEGDDEEKFLKAYEIVNKIGSAVKIGNSQVSSHVALAARGYDVPYMKKPLVCDYSKHTDKMAELAKLFEEYDAQMAELLPGFKFVK